ncbi:protein PSK SIMULATOR 1-like [Juglans regia]|uniref:Protein PSK SIMULATOR 1-like n=1 Tax=Juglans regia TaxID=51240 RepID=A0A2I4GEJ6_JUGRE|nr:protein PSK SIMULATOR 1-like [Juglans regia]
MVAEPWIVKIGSQVSSNLRHKLLLEPSKRKSPKNNYVPKQTIGILSFEVATVMSKTVLLHKSLTDSEISKLKTEVLKSEGVLNLVSSDEVHLLELALSEKLDDLNHVSCVVSRLGKKCTEPALQGFEHVYGDVVSGVIDVRELGFLVKDMEGMVRKMERLVNATANLYTELEVLNELEQSTKKFQHNQHKESKRAFEQKLIWRRQDVRHLKEISLWNQTYDKVVELLARTVCTIYSRICIVFGDPAMKSKNSQSGLDLHRRLQTGSGAEQLKRVFSRSSENHSVEKKVTSYKSQFDSRRGEVALFRPEEFSFPCGTSPGRLFMDCLSLSSSVSKYDEDDDDGDRDDRISRVSRVCISGNAGRKREHVNYSNHVNRSQTGVPFSGDQREYKSGVMQSARFGPKSRLTVYAPSTTVGGSALALHYANVIIIIEKLLRYPHLVGEEARDDLYQMLPTSLRMSLRTNLKSYVNNLAIYDAPLAHDWKDNLDGILKWLAPLAHNMIRWQSERNFEQHQIVTRTNVLLLQTLYFADREKTEAALCELLVGLNYICRYEHQQNALLDCASSFDFEDCMEWQLQCGATYLH